uniref:DUF2490 domain-containing protein n=1 Tax=Flavobacterium sp. TaxID=239 RepID=UPI00404A0671
MTKINITKLLLILGIFSVFGQSYTDLQGRFISSVDYELTKKFKISGEYRYSVDTDLARFRSSLGEIDLKYNISKRFRLSGGYRFASNFEEDTHRIFGALKYDKKWGDFKINIASKYQFSTNSFDQDFMNFYKEPVQTLREEIGLDYDIPNSKAVVFVSAEIFLRMQQQPYLEYNRMRYSVGGSYEFKYGVTMQLSAFYDDRIDPRRNDRIVLVSKVNVSIDGFMKKLKKNKKKKLKKLVKQKEE